MNVVVLRRYGALRSYATIGLLVVIFFSFLVRLIYLHLLREFDSAAQGDVTRGSRQIVSAHRGRISDIHNETLASEIPLQKIVIDGTRLTKSDELVSLLAQATHCTEKQIRKKLDTRRPYRVLKSQIPEKDANLLASRLATLRQKGIYFEPDSTRAYPNGHVLCHLLGFVGYPDSSEIVTGVQGIELYSDKYLRGSPGYRWVEQDRAGVELVQHRGLEQPVQHGCDVTLSIDMGLQTILESELDAAVKKFTPISAIAIMIRPTTGEVLALANRPDFDLNRRNEALPEQMRNRAITDLVEPGSTFKIVTHSAALQEKLVRPDTRIFCENGHWEYGGTTLHDAHPSGELTIRESLAKSSNIAAGKLGLQLGESRLYQYIKAFGFGDRTGIDLPGEVPGLLHPIQKWSKISITHIPMGQEVGVTPIQLISAMSVIANHGKLMMPQTINSVTDAAGKQVSGFRAREVRQIVNEEAKNAITNALLDVVSSKGTAKGAAVPGFKVAGKTGTAQKAGPHGGYLSGKYVVSFVGFMPAEHPEFVCLVMFDEANTKPGENYGGSVAGPVFANIALRAASYLGLEPSEPLLIASDTSSTRENKSSQKIQPRD